MNIFKKAIKEAEKLDKAIEEVTTPTPTPEPEEEWIWVEGYKGTDKNMCCREYQYELGKQHDMPEDEEIKECVNGFHLCLTLDDVFKYYQIGYGNRFFKVQALVRKADADQYDQNVCSSYYGLFDVSTKDKLAAKSIILVSELAIDEILKDTDAHSLPQEYKQMAIDCGIESAIVNYKINTLVEDGYALAFATHIVNNDKFDIAHVVGSQKDLSMDIKVLSILYNNTGVI
jgi:hypothetical protein